MICVFRDRKKKRFISSGNTEKAKKKIKTESGNWISASYKSDLYKKWKQKSKAEQNEEQDSDDQLNQEKTTRNEQLIQHKSNKKSGSKRPPKRELKNREEIYKERQKLERKKAFMKWRQSEKAKAKNNKNKSDKKR